MYLFYAVPHWRAPFGKVGSLSKYFNCYNYYYNHNRDFKIENESDIQIPIQSLEQSRTDLSLLLSPVTGTLSRLIVEIAIF